MSSKPKHTLTELDVTGTLVRMTNKRRRPTGAAAARRALHERYPSASRFVLWRARHFVLVHVFLGPLQEGAETPIEDVARERRDRRGHPETSFTRPVQ